MDTEKLKQKILDLAIRGKLVPQDPNDETAQDLIKKIQEEKIKLIKEGKIKSTKNESYIFKDSNNSYYEKVGTTIKNIDDEIPFEIPNNWCWVRLNQIGSIIGGGTPSTSVKEYWNNGNIVWVTPAYMSKNKHTYISDSDRKITQLGLNNSSTKLMPPYSIIMSSRAPIGYLAINLVPACTSQGCKSIVPFIKDMSVYLYYAIKSSITRIIEASSGTTFDEISGKDFGNLLIPISSINEQLKICNLLSKVFDQVEEISQNYKNIKKYISVAKIKILENIFGENSSYKSYYENYACIKDLTITISTNNKEIKTQQIKNNGKYPVVSQSKLLIDGYYDDETKLIDDYPLIIFGDHTRCVKYIDFAFIPGADGTKLIKPINLDTKYLYYGLIYASNKIYNNGYARHFSKLKQVLLPITKREIQIKIVDYIDNVFYILDSII